MKISTRSIALILATCCLAVAAGIAAGRALANGNTTYCYQCTLPSDGVPAKSNVFKDFYYNEFSSLGGYVAPHIYNYYSGTTTCQYHSDYAIYIYTGYPGGQDSCIPTTTFADARCQLLHGTGPVEAVCQADYETAG